MNKTTFPLDANMLDKIIKDYEVDLSKIGIRELKRMVDFLTEQYHVDFLHFEFGVPGIPAERKGPEE